MPCPYRDTNTTPSKPPGGLGAASTPALRIQCWLEARLLLPSRSVTLHKFRPSQGLPSLAISTVWSFWHLLLGTPPGDLPIEMPHTCYHMRLMHTLSHGKVRKRWTQHGTHSKGPGSALGSRYSHRFLSGSESRLES